MARRRQSRSRLGRARRWIEAVAAFAAFTTGSRAAVEFTTWARGQYVISTRAIAWQVQLDSIGTYDRLLDGLRGQGERHDRRGH